MRCMVRTFLVITLAVLVIIYFAIRATNTVDEDEYEAAEDDEARRLLEGDVVVPSDRPSVSVSVALIVVICLIAVALLITGIIIVAVTLDPTTNDDESDIESDDSKSRMSPASLYTAAEYDHLFGEPDDELYKYSSYINSGY